jgi:predicted nucleic acid-binding protein
MSRIYWDTMLFVYWLEDHPGYSARVEDIFRRMQERRDVLCASAFTLGELLTGPMKRNAGEVTARIQSFFESSALEVASFTPETALRYAQIRASQKVSPPDAIHLACAAQAGTDLFLTNDQRLKGLAIPGIHFIAGMDLELL